MPGPIVWTISQNGLDLIAMFENLSLNSYLDARSGEWTIGYGHTDGVYEGQTITEQQAFKYLRSDCQPTAKAIKNLDKVKINQNQFDPLISFT